MCHRVKRGSAAPLRRVGGMVAAGSGGGGRRGGRGRKAPVKAADAAGPVSSEQVDLQLTAISMALMVLSRSHPCIQILRFVAQSDLGLFRSIQVHFIVHKWDREG